MERNKREEGRSVTKEVRRREVYKLVHNGTHD